MERAHAPIGIFDSGLGGLSVWKAIRELLPGETLIYAADSARCPYGERAEEEIQQFSQQITMSFMLQSCKMVVVACNTATAAAITDLRREWPNIPFVGMEPAVKPAASDTQSQVIGVLATKGTLAGGHFQRALQTFTQGKEVLIQEGKGLVELVEAGLETSEQARDLLRTYVDPMLAAGADQVVLGCTHYPFFRSILQELVGETVTIVDPAPAIARQVQHLLQKAHLLRRSSAKPLALFWTSGDVVRMRSFLQAQKLMPHPTVVSVNWGQA
ncbi:MAG: glutamate racemase [Bacteroidota bacterium]